MARPKGVRETKPRAQRTVDKTPAPTARAGGGLDISGPQLAQLLALDERSVRRLDTDGVIIRAPGRGRYDMVASVRAYCTKLREAAAGRQAEKGGINAVEEGALLKRAQRLKKEMEAKLLDGTLLTIAQVEEAGAEVLASVRAIALTFPDAVQARCPHFKREEIEAIREVARMVLEYEGVVAWERDKLPPPIGEIVAAAAREREGLPPE